MPPQLSPKLKEKTADAWNTALSGHLHPGEVVWAFAKTNNLRPLIDGIAVTNARIIGFLSSDVAGKGPKVAVDADEISGFEVVKKFASKVFVVTSRTRGEISLGTVPDAEVDFIKYFVHQLASAGYPQQIRAAAFTAQAERAQQEQARQEGRREVRRIGRPLSDKEWEILHSHAAATELPWFVINPGGGTGFLAAFEDRLIIAKVSGMASLMAGSFGGGRVTTFSYTDITSIEYNSGMVNGVLEVLTPSYQGTANHDFWRSSHKDRNKASDDPWTLSNCLPLSRPDHKLALPLLVELQRKVAEAKRPNVGVQSPQEQSQPPSSGLTDELKGLSELHSQGILDAAEFAAAKHATIAKYSG
ncbi:PH domain-containing protein [Nocardia goodfellowii]|uniref:SHOCT domain-containing protein n=1 Tax=Nocardia goodfellowii TaxID=882446 RepID=A0ABS4QNA1_9NOCA|nr:SHOCT domain-containing protein [Nocardia goodfellowii]MBP2192146.1 hypothetical protein [Nocardia goodfellowii]